MPKPSDGESKKAFLARCIPQLIEEGRDQSQAISICNSMYDNKKSTRGSKRTSKEYETDRILSI